MSKITRRDFVKTSVSSVAAMSALSPLAFAASTAAKKSKVVIVCTDNRTKGVADIVRLLQVSVPKGKNVVIKPNFNSADPAPGSTHNDTLRQLMKELMERDAREITIAERSGPPVNSTRGYMEKKGVFDLANEFKASVVNFEEMPETDWVPMSPAGSHWTNGWMVPRVLAQSPYTVSTCCLKTHGFGGVFSMSLKLAVGTAPKRLMSEMHGNREHMRRMIAELNLGYKPAFIVMDGVEAFTDGGPAKGNKVAANVMIGGTDRVAVDAVGVAILKELGANQAIMGKKVFEHDQIQRAGELGLGVKSADEIDLVTGDATSRAYADKIGKRLLEG